MTNPLSPRLSQRRRFSQEAFRPLTHKDSYDRDNMASSHTNKTGGDITIDIPLTTVPTNKSTGARKPNALSPQLTHPPSDSTLNEKHSFHRHQDSDGFRGRRKRMEARGLKNKDASDGSKNVLGKFYDTVYHFSIVTRYMLFVAPLALCIAVPIVIGATAAQNARIGGVRIVWFFTWIEVVWCSLWISKLFAKFLPFLFQFLIGVVSSGTRKYSSVITALEIPLSLVFWAIVSLTTFVPLMTLNPDARSAGRTNVRNWQKILTNILAACLFSTLVLLGEKLIIQLISISYHRKQFDDKIKESKRNIHLTGLLYDASRALFPAYCPEFAEEDFVIADNMDFGLASRGGKSHARSGSATPMKLLHNAARIGDKVQAAFGNVAHEITGKQVFNATSAHSVVLSALEKKKSSEALARRLWLSFVLEGRDALYEDDIKDVLGPDREAEAQEAFFCLDVDGNGDISLDEMILRITEFGRDRDRLANSMRDVDQAIHVLDNLLMTVVFIVVVFIFVAWLNSNFTTTLATTGTALLSLSFVFAVTCQEVLGSCIFLFVKHPYDVGDRVDIEDKQYVVERISLLYTIFHLVGSHKKTQVPNIVLNTKWIDNVTRSKAMREQINIYISFDTTFEDVELLKREMQKFVLDKENARDFRSDVNIEVTGIAEMNKMELKVEVFHKSNWHNEVVRAVRRNKFMCALVVALRKVPIYAPGGGSAAAGDKANPTYSVAISHDEAEQNKDLYAKDKEAARLVPSPPKDSDGDAKASGNDFFADSDVEAKERAQVMGQVGLTQRSPTVVVNSLQASAAEEALERQRTEDVEEVRNILRKESVSHGRRKAHQQDALSPNSAALSAGVSPYRTTSEHVPAPVASGAAQGASVGSVPAVPPQAAARLASRQYTSPQGVDYYEDNGFAPAQVQTSGQFNLPAPVTSPFAPMPPQGSPQNYRPRGASIGQQGPSGRTRSGSDARKPVAGSRMI